MLDADVDVHQPEQRTCKTRQKLVHTTPTFFPFITTHPHPLLCQEKHAEQSWRTAQTVTEPENVDEAFATGAVDTGQLNEKHAPADALRVGLLVCQIQFLE